MVKKLITMIMVLIMTVLCVNTTAFASNSKVTGVALSKTTLSLVVYGEWQLSAKVNPTNATNKNIAWKSSNTKVATVSSTGVVRGKGNGKATITATTKDGSGKSQKCTVSVRTTEFSKLQAELYKHPEMKEHASRNVVLATGRKIVVPDGSTLIIPNNARLVHENFEIAKFGCFELKGNAKIVNYGYLGIGNYLTNLILAGPNSIIYNLGTKNEALGHDAPNQALKYNIKENYWYPFIPNLIASKITYGPIKNEVTPVLLNFTRSPYDRNVGIIVKYHIAGQAVNKVCELNTYKDKKSSFDIASDLAEVAAKEAKAITIDRIDVYNNGYAYEANLNSEKPISIKVNWKLNSSSKAIDPTNIAVKLYPKSPVLSFEGLEKGASYVVSYTAVAEADKTTKYNRLFIVKDNYIYSRNSTDEWDLPITGDTSILQRVTTSKKGSGSNDYVLILSKPVIFQYVLDPLLSSIKSATVDVSDLNMITINLLRDFQNGDNDLHKGNIEVRCHIAGQPNDSTEVLFVKDIFDTGAITRDYCDWNNEVDVLKGTKVPGLNITPYIQDLKKQYANGTIDRIDLRSASWLEDVSKFMYSKKVTSVDVNIPLASVPVVDATLSQNVVLGSDRIVAVTFKKSDTSSTHTDTISITTIATADIIRFSYKDFTIRRNFTPGSQECDTDLVACAIESAEPGTTTLTIQTTENIGSGIAVLWYKDKPIERIKIDCK